MKDLPMALTVPQVADELSVSVRTVYKLIEKGELLSIKVAGARRVTRQQLEDYLLELNGAAS